MTDTLPAVAWLGTGLMGTPMASRLLQQGYQVRVWNRTRKKAESLQSAGGRIFAHPGEAVSGARLVFTTLSDFSATETVLDQADLVGKVVIQMATISPEQSKALASLVIQKSGEYLEAPVLGSIPEAGSGRLIIMAGGTESLFERVRRVLEVLGQNPRLIGGVGQAAALELALNQLIASLTVAFATSLAYVRNHGIEVETFMETLRQSALYAPTFDKKLPRMASHDYKHPNFPTEHLLKDIHLFLQSAEGLDTSPLEAMCALYGDVLCKHRFEDYSCVFEAVTAEMGTSAETEPRK